MGILKESIETINEILKLSRSGWTKLEDGKVPAWLLKSAKRRYKKCKKPIGSRSHFIGRTFFYRVWYTGKKEWVFYKALRPFLLRVGKRKYD